MRKKLVLKALTDAKFRKELKENPEGALTAEELASINGGVAELINIVDDINATSGKISDLIFCMIVDDKDGPIYA